MKKIILPILMSFGFLFAFTGVQAQTPYRTALGLGIDAGNGQTLFGPQIKHSFGGYNAGNAQLLFGDHITVLGVDYSYNQRISGARGLSWYIGVGPQLSFIDHGKWDDDWFDDDDRWDEDNHVDVAIRPAVGLEFRIPSTPLAMHFDWKPWWNLSHSSHFEPGRFSLGFKFVLK
ncbi:hypothetical protein [Sphingobacterium hotanense]|nr:hypothetical protein [Sphingobacterium hotanense]